MSKHIGLFEKWWVVLAVLSACGVWIFAIRVVIPYQRADAVAHERPRGNLSDLYPRWLGSRELLLHGRDPYSLEVTRKIQQGFYGRELDPSRPNDPKDEQRFAYPVYVAFILAPTVRLSFEVVERSFFWIFLVITVASVAPWLQVLKWRPSWPIQVTLILLTVGGPAVLQGVMLRQLSLLVAVLVSGALALLVSNRLGAAGCLLALATIKPQLAWLLLLWLAIWTLGDWRRRSPLMLSFLLTMFFLVVGAELLLPHWILRFWEAIHEYRRYTGAASVLDAMGTPSLSVVVAALGAVMIGRVWWREHKQPANTESFSRVICLVLAVTVLISPNSVLYNQVLLLPSMFLFARDWRRILELGFFGKLLIGVVAAAITWPLISSGFLAVLSFVMRPEVIQQFWAVPLWTVWLIPVSVSALMLVVAHRAAFGRSETHRKA